MLIALLLSSAVALADDSDVCGPLKSANDILECVKTRSPETLRLEQERDGALDEAKATRRWLNPIVNSQTMFGKNLGNDQYLIQVGLMQTIEFGPKRGYKNTLADSIEKRAGAEFTVNLGQDLFQTGADLVRLNQLKHEIGSVEEAIATFNKLIGQFSNRPRLSPEQEVSMSVYKLSRGDFLVRQNELVREKQEILIRFKSKLQLNESTLNAMDSNIKLSFPPLSKLDFPESTSPELKVIDADVTAAQASLNLERSDVFSEIQVGPLAQFNADGFQRDQFYGFQLNIPFPVWNQNGHGINSAAKRLKAAEIRADVKKRAVKEEWEQLIQNYGRLRDLLNSIPSLDDIEVRHKKVETQIYRGLVSSALVVESHRSLVDLQKSRHQSELAALLALWHVMIIQGKISEIRL